MEDDGRVVGIAQEVIAQDLRAMLRGAVRLGLEACLDAELEVMIGADWYVRGGGRRDQRNGSYRRQFLTSLGQVDLAMPRGRRGGRPSQVLGRYQRRMDEVDGLLTSAYVSGVSTRKLGTVTTALFGERVSRSTVSRVTERLAQTVEGLRRARSTSAQRVHEGAAPPASPGGARGHGGGPGGEPRRGQDPAGALRRDLGASASRGGRVSAGGLPRRHDVLRLPQGALGPAPDDQWGGATAPGGQTADARRRGVSGSSECAPAGDGGRDHGHGHLGGSGVPGHDVAGGGQGGLTMRPRSPLSFYPTFGT